MELLFVAALVGLGLSTAWEKRLKSSRAKGGLRWRWWVGGGSAAVAVLVVVAVPWLLVGLPLGGVWWLRPSARLRRNLGRAVRRSTLEDKVGKLKGVRVALTPAGETYTVKVPRTVSPEILTGGKWEGVLAVNLSTGRRPVQEVRICQGAHAGVATISVVRRDPLSSVPAATGRVWAAAKALVRALSPGPVVDRWPLLDAPRLSLWDRIPVGLDENGDVVCISLVERHLLLAGESGSGKSVLMSMPVAVAALDPTCMIVGLDGKRVELSPWKDSFARFVTTDYAEAVATLTAVSEAIDVRLEWLESNPRSDGTPRRKIEPDCPFGFLVVVCDELAYYVTPLAGQFAGQLQWLLGDILFRGRAAGVIVIGVTQKPEDRVLPSYLRDQYTQRASGRQTTTDASDTGLGRGMAAAGLDATKIAIEDRGVMLMVNEGRKTRFKTFHLTDGDVARLAGRAAGLRAGVVGVGGLDDGLAALLDGAVAVGALEVVEPGGVGSVVVRRVSCRPFGSDGHGEAA